VLPNSRALVNSIGANEHLFPALGSGRYKGGKIGIPYVVVPGRQRKVHVSFDYPDSDHVPYPLPPNLPVEAAVDHHAIVIDRGNCRLYELYDVHRNGDGSWHAQSGAHWNLRSNKLRPKYHTSADAAGLPMFPGLIRYDEVRAGVIRHALRVSVPDTRQQFIYPARHIAGDSHSPNVPAMGQRFRLRASFNVSGFPRPARIILTALKRYGMIVADDGAPLYLDGPPNEHWNNGQLFTIERVHASDFQAVDTSKLPRP
jgi:hypothetical protein